MLLNCLLLNDILNIHDMTLQRLNCILMVTFHGIRQKFKSHFRTDDGYFLSHADPENRVKHIVKLTAGKSLIV